MNYERELKRARELKRMVENLISEYTNVWSGEDTKELYGEPVFIEGFISQCGVLLDLVDKKIISLTNEVERTAKHLEDLSIEDL